MSKMETKEVPLTHAGRVVGTAIIEYDTAGARVISSKITDPEFKTFLGSPMLEHISIKAEKG